MRMIKVAAFLLALAAFAPVPVGAAELPADDGDVDFMAPFDPELKEKIRQANGECYGCHSEQGVKHPVRADMDLAKLATMTVPAAGYDAGSHTGINCQDCHAAGYADFPHAEPVLTKACIDCHNRHVPDIEKELKRSVHHESMAAPFTCETCHDPHLYQTAAKIGAPRLIVAQDNAACIQCHDSATEMARFVPGKTYPRIDSAHSWLPNTRFHWQSVRCVDCHAARSEEAHHLPHDIGKKDKAEHNCVACHSQTTVLRNRLYRHLAEKERAGNAGFINAYILSDAYVVGATRNVWLDKASFVILGLTVAALAVHALGRILTSTRRRKNRDG